MSTSFFKLRRSHERPVPSHSVLIITAGGLEHGGGIGRQMGYFLAACRANPQRLHYRVVDSRGPWYIGASPHYVLFSIAYFCKALLTVLLSHFSSPCIAHVNISGRGSTVRKILILTIGQAVGLRYILHLHDYDYAAYYHGQRALHRKLIARTFRRAVRVVVLGKRELEVISHVFRLQRDRVIVLHNAVPDFLPAVERPRHKGKPCHILFLGHLSARKGVPDLLQALAGASLRPLGWYATLAGGGPIDEYRRLADELGILERLRFTGWVNEHVIRDLCADAEVLVLPSHAEGLAMSVLEGLSHGLAVVTTPVGAHLEVIEPGVSGLLVPPGDVSALADALARVLADENLRKRLAKGARERFVDHFDVCHYATKLEALHADLFAGLCRGPEAMGEGLAS